MEINWYLPPFIRNNVSNNIGDIYTVWLSVNKYLHNLKQQDKENVGLQNYSSCCHSVNGENPCVQKNLSAVPCHCRNVKHIYTLDQC